MSKLSLFPNDPDQWIFDLITCSSLSQVIRAHRVLLSAGSGYLEKVLALAPSTDHPTVVLSNIKYKELKLLVDFMYSGECLVIGQRWVMQPPDWLSVILGQN